MNPIQIADEAAQLGVSVLAEAHTRKELFVSKRPLSVSQVWGSALSTKSN